MSTTDRADQYDAIVIGAGQGGKPLAVALASAGRQTALIERKYLGGTCINYGCTPTKTMIASGRAAYLARRGGDFGVLTGSVNIDMTVVRKRKREIVRSFREGSEKQVTETDRLDLFYGHARFTGDHTLSVDLSDASARTLSAPEKFINCGARPMMPPIDGIETVGALDSTSIMELDHVPEHLIVLGGGYVGLEFGQLFCRLGSTVTIVQLGDQLLATEDSDIAAEVRRVLEDDGIEVLLNTAATAAGKNKSGQIELTVSADGLSRTITGSHLLVATGRRPNTDDLSVEKAGLDLDDPGFVKVNNRLGTNVDGIWALGDIKGGPAFTHISYDDYRVLKTNLIDGGDATIGYRHIPYTVFIDPQLGRVGLSEKQAKKLGRKYRAVTMPMNRVARALEMGESRDLVKALIDPDTKQILGCAILGLEGGEMMNMIQIAMMGELPFTALRAARFAHPTLGESLNNLFARSE